LVGFGTGRTMLFLPMSCDVTERIRLARMID
jgi:hypothetical protein